MFLGSGCGSFFLDGRANEVSPLGPGAVVIAYVFYAEKIFQHKPGVGAALTDAAVGDDFLVAGNTFGAVELLQGVGALESSVFVHRLRPGDTCGTRDVTGALRGFGHARRSDDLAGKF